MLQTMGRLFKIAWYVVILMLGLSISAIFLVKEIPNATIEQNLYESNHPISLASDAKQ